jgi:hypothetical protein
VSRIPDLVAIFHSAFVAFVIVGFILILTGDAFRWRWTRNPYFRAAHFLAIGFVTLRTWLAVPCPLTVLETRLRNGSPAKVKRRRWEIRSIAFRSPAWTIGDLPEHESDLHAKQHMALLIFVVVSAATISQPAGGQGDQRSLGG